MDIDRARTFLEIVHSGSFLRAADRLHVTQTTVSARIRTLEEELGRQLFVRNRNGAQLTQAGREFERFAQSFVQIWERARHQLAIPSGRTSVVALGGELSLWNPLLLDWLVWMKKARPEIAIQAQVGVPDQLLEQLRTGVLDIAVLYAPKLLPGFKVELLVEEQLVLVRTKNEEPAGAKDYVYVDWGPLFAAQHDASSTAFGEPGLLVGLGPLGLSYILRAGGMGYFRRGAAALHIDSGELEIVEGAPEFTYPAYAVYPEANETRTDIQEALRGLKQVVK
ncbi:MULTISPECIES: LysR family transcriptional regulator [unclassified Mesorhizobium]|uniref:LysR family transcriptional regulator n=1 Tax=unclassified Mesorhizobium TaxID=325217 RepID=UPI00112B3559|nr:MULTISPECIES: LysR family transcriptional regulator [unclassified Mesorhizobium]MBZ9811325.1 LysR family transcriptional regulator [Mesorhizobium sp. ESP-6-2]TPM25893.1 LysR family transcriptional regulator [Mesorhizobium sp. B2-2-2]